MSQELPPEADRVRLLLLDVDGVLTDGALWIADDGSEMKRFHVHDGAAIVAWRETGRDVAILSGRRSPAVRVRARELGIERVIEGSRDKLAALSGLLAELRVHPADVCYVGDDVPDLPVLRAVGFPVAPSNACAEAKEAARYVTRRAGGDGAVRELVEHLLGLRGQWPVATETAP